MSGRNSASRDRAFDRPGLSRSRAVRFPGDGLELAGEIVAPDTAGPHPAVVLLHGAGQGEREFYRVIAERFAEEGVASLIFDRRGHGESDGPRDMDLFVLGRDGAAAWRFLAGQPEVDAARVGLWGYSNGAWVASLAANALPDLAFLVLAGAAGVTPGRAEAYRRATDLRTQGIASNTVEAVERAWTLVFDLFSSRSVPPSLKGDLSQLAAVIQADDALEGLAIPEFVRERPELDSVPRFDHPPLNGPLDAIAGRSPDMGYDPIPTLRQLTCPTLVVLAENDANAAPVESLERFGAMAKSRPGVHVEMLLGASHSFTVMPVSERDNPELLHRPLRRDEYDPRYLDLMARWLGEVTRTGIP
ncbi:MAG: alpha/beta fold hydrolase [Dehalococcoidia bacterium]